MSPEDKAKLEGLMTEYLMDPFNCINLNISSAVTVGIPIIGAENVSAILSGYLVTCIQMVNHNYDLEAAEYLVDDIVQELQAAIGAMQGAGTTPVDSGMN